MNINPEIIEESEKLIFTLRSLYAKQGFSPYKMSKFENYDLYARNKDFLVSENVLTFTDTNGQLKALKPDVTLSIIKNTDVKGGQIQKLYYNENVYRPTPESGFKEQMQIGAECIGDLTDAEIAEVIILAAKSLKEISNNQILEISNIDIPAKIIDSLDIARDDKDGLFRCIGEKNFHNMKIICEENNLPDIIYETLKDLASMYKGAGEACEKLEKILEPLDSLGLLGQEILEICENFKNILHMISCSDDTGIIKINFSVTGDLRYYNGIIFNGYVSEVAEAVLKGGQYDALMKSMNKYARAIGFAVYADLLERMENVTSDDFITVALPKGRLGEKVYALFEEAGFNCPEIKDDSRKLVFENSAKKIRFFWAKPSDVAIYVEKGSADIGICGKDILNEEAPDLYELLDMNMGKCSMCVAGPSSFKDDSSKTLRVATKFSNCARNYFDNLGRNIEIIHLNGSIEIAPILALSDVIFDIVETGTTLRENNLVVLSKAFDISARLVSNKSSYKFKAAEIENIKSTLLEVINDKNS